MKFSINVIKKVIKEDLNINYKKIKRILFTRNYEINLILRQQLSIKMIELFTSNYLIINIDEKWLSQSDFHSRKSDDKRNY